MFQLQQTNQSSQRRPFCRRISVGGTTFSLFLLAVAYEGLAARGADRKPPVASSQATKLPKGEEVLDSVLARATAVSSGRFELVRSTGFRRDPNSRTPRGPYRFSLSGDDWARRALHEKNVIVNRGNQSMSLFSHPVQDDGTRDYGARFEPPVNVRKVEGDTSPFFAGTFWLQMTIDFVSSRRDSMKLVGVETIDHIETVVLEWPIAASDVFKVLPEANGVTGSGGVLRLYAAPSLGYALPRIELIGTSGKVGCRFESTDFRQVAPALWFPMKSTWEWYDPKPAFYEEYEFSEVTLVNRPMPKEDFEFSVPAKTSLTDMRNPALQARIEVKSETSQVELEALLRGAQRYGTVPSRPTPPVASDHSNHSTARWVLIVLDVVVVFVLVAALCVRLARRGRQSSSPRKG